MLDEVVELAKIAGFHISHMRDEASNVVRSVEETIRIGENGRVPTQVTHHKTVGTAAWGKTVETLRLIDEAPRTGIRSSRVAFLHPASTGGVLTEVVEPAAHAAAAGAVERGEPA